MLPISKGSLNNATILNQYKNLTLKTLVSILKYSINSYLFIILFLMAWFVDPFVTPNNSSSNWTVPPTEPSWTQPIPEAQPVVSSTVSLDQLTNEVTNSTPSSDTITTQQPSLWVSLDEIVDNSNQPLSVEETRSSSSSASLSSSSSTELNLDTMLAWVTMNTSTIEPNSDHKTGITGKKRKILITVTALIGLIILWLTGYMVFTTMFPVETEQVAKTVSDNLKADVSWTTTPTSNETNTTSSEELPQLPSVTQTWDTTTWTIPTYQPEEELPTGDSPIVTAPSSENFGQNDELPANNTTTSNTTTEQQPTTNDTAVNPNLETVKNDLNKKIDQAKQLLTLIKSKGWDTEQIKKLAGLIKEVKTLLVKITNNEFTTFSSEIQQPLSDLTFRFDQFTSEVVGSTSTAPSQPEEELQ